MELRRLITDDDAVSPVIGVILMVAITVILAAVIGAFVLGFGGGGPSAPNVQWDTSADTTADSVTFRHGGGDDVSNPSSILSVVDDGGNAAAGYTWNAGGDSQMSTSESVDADFSAVGGGVTAGDEYELVWEPEDGDSSQVLASHTV